MCIVVSLHFDFILALFTEVHMKHTNLTLCIIIFFLC